MIRTLLFSDRAFAMMSVAGEGTFDDIKYTDGTTSFTGKGELEYEPTFVLIVEGHYMLARPLGVIGGLNYGGEQTFKKGNIKREGQKITLTSTSDPSEVQMSTLYGNVVYR